MQDNLGDDFYIWPRFVVVQENQIDVGVRIELAASVTAARHDGKALVEPREALSMPIVRVAIKRAHERVCGRRQGVRDFESAGARAMSSEEIFPHPIEMLSRNRSRTCAAFHRGEQRRLLAYGTGPGVLRGVVCGEASLVHRFPTAASAL